MNNEKIKTYDEVNNDEKEMLDTLKDLKISYDKTKFELIDYQIIII